MPSLNSNEKRLLTFFGIAAFLAANVLGYFLISTMMKELESKEAGLKKRLHALEEARDKAPEADAKREYMDTHLERYSSEEAREVYLDGVVNGALTNGLDVELSKSRTPPTETTEYFVKSRFTTNVKGPWQDVKEFIYRLQKPADFRLVTKLSMMPKKSEGDDSVQLVEVSVDIEKWWPKPDDYAEAPETAVAQNEQPAADAVKPTTPDAAAPAPDPAPAGETAVTPPPAPPAETPPAPPSAPADSSAPVIPPPDNSQKPTTL